MELKLPNPEGLTAYHRAPYPRIDVTRPSLSTAGRVVFITGGGTGIGLECTKHFAKAGSRRIAITGRRQQVLEEAKQSIERIYPDAKVLVLPGDVRDRDAVDAAFKAATDAFGPIDILVNNAGYSADYEPLGKEPTPADWWSAFEINIKGSHNIITAFLQTAAPDATVINISSATVNTLVPQQSAYSASKCANVRLFEALQLEYPNYRVINLAPGVIMTDMLRKSIASFEVQGLRLLVVDEIELPASFAVWACSPEAAFIKGKFVWVNWDVDELEQLVAKNSDNPWFLMLGVQGVANFSITQ